MRPWSSRRRAPSRGMSRRSSACRTCSTSSTTSAWRRRRPDRPGWSTGAYGCGSLESSAPPQPNMQNARMETPRHRHRAARAMLVCILTSALCISVWAAPQVAAASPVTLDVLLTRVFEYVDRFQREFGSMVAEERYDQWVRSNATGAGRGGDLTRTLRSDFLLVDVPGQGWTPFRDVFEADGRQIRDRQDRLTALFLSGTRDSALEQA